MCLVASDLFFELVDEALERSHCKFADTLIAVRIVAKCRSGLQAGRASRVYWPIPIRCSDS